MPELDKAKASLTELGWSEYESKTYSALVQLGRATASKIAKNSNVPPNRVYQILGKLSEKGIVHKADSRGTATEYEAVDPGTVLNNVRTEFSEKIDKALLALEELKERTLDKDFPVTYTIYGKRELASYLQQTIKNSDSEVFIAVDTLVELRHRELIDILNNKANLIDIQILTTERGINDEYEKEVIEDLDDRIPIKISIDGFSTIFLISDNKIMIYSAYGYKEDNSGDLDYYGVYTDDNKTARLIVKSFKLAYNEGSYVHEPKSNGDLRSENDIVLEIDSKTSSEE